MAKNSRELDAKHALYSATTGGGKTTAIKKSKELCQAKRIALYDPYNAYDKLGRKTIVKTHSLREFAATLARAMNNTKPFAVGLCGVYGKKELVIFAEIVWAVADGTKELNVVVGELARAGHPRSLDCRGGGGWGGGRVRRCAYGGGRGFRLGVK